MFPLEDKTVTHSANQFTIKRNTEYIHKLRQENKRLYKQLSAAKAVSPTLRPPVSFVLGYLSSMDHTDFLLSQILFPLASWFPG